MPNTKGCLHSYDKQQITGFSTVLSASHGLKEATLCSNIANWPCFFFTLLKASVCTGKIIFAYAKSIASVKIPNLCVLQAINIYMRFFPCEKHATAPLASTQPLSQHLASALHSSGPWGACLQPEPTWFPEKPQGRAADAGISIFLLEY